MLQVSPSVKETESESRSWSQTEPSPAATQQDQQDQQTSADRRKPAPVLTLILDQTEDPGARLCPDREQLQVSSVLNTDRCVERERGGCWVINGRYSLVSEQEVKCVDQQDVPAAADDSRPSAPEQGCQLHHCDQSVGREGSKPRPSAQTGAVSERTRCSPETL